MRDSARTIGINVEYPKETCTDNQCPFHGTLKVRGRMFTGTIVSSKMHRTAVVEWEWQHYIPKYERYERRRTKIKVHNPECIRGVEGDIVKIIACRPLSKTKHFVIIEKLGKERGFKEKIAAKEAAKVEKPKKEEKMKEQQEVEEGIVEQNHATS